MDLVAGAIAAVRLEAAVELTHAIDSLVLLERCERATGRPYVSGTDRTRVSDARARYLAVRA